VISGGQWFLFHRLTAERSTKQSQPCTVGGQYISAPGDIRKWLTSIPWGKLWFSQCRIQCTVPRL